MTTTRQFEKLGNTLIDELGLKLHVADFDPRERVVSLQNYGTKTAAGLGRVIARLVREVL